MAQAGDWEASKTAKKKAAAAGKAATAAALKAEEAAKLAVAAADKAAKAAQIWPGAYGSKGKGKGNNDTMKGK
jgi:hypothetical protein